MSHIPSHAMPHAGPANQLDDQGRTETSTESTAHSRSAFGQLAEKVREYPKTTIAAGAAVAAGVVAATLTSRSRDRSKSSSKSRKS
ncbi:MAG TPA: hypothetical protein VFO69_06500 [Allosphingosinicella sp.]|nr:hypothetical protein [Allosphingosinicella sp.]